MSRIIVFGILVLLYISGLTFALFESCDFNISLTLGKPLTINSINYPNQYSPGSSCRYKLTAPVGTRITLQCQIKLSTTTSGSCKNEYFYIASDGYLNLSNSEHLCGAGTLTRNSEFSELTIAYTSASTGSSSTGAFACIATVQAVPCDCGWSVSSRIIGGVNALVNEYPSIVGLVYAPPRGSVFCGGTIISQTMVLTSAQCLDAFTITTVGVLVGESDVSTGTESPYTKLYLPKRFIKHPNYSSTTSANNIGLIETTAPIIFSRGVGPACLPFSYTSESFVNQVVEVAGWGTIEFAGPPSKTLKKVSLTVVSNSKCTESYSQLLQSQMCTYTPGKDACQYDSGGPLYMRRNRMYLVGTVSYGNACGSSTPTVHTRVTPYLTWIKQYIPTSGLCVK